MYIQRLKEYAVIHSESEDDLDILYIIFKEEKPKYILPLRELNEFWRAYLLTLRVDRRARCLSICKEAFQASVKYNTSVIPGIYWSIAEWRN